MSNYVESGEWELRAIWAERYKIFNKIQLIYANILSFNRNLVYYPCCPVSRSFYCCFK